MGRGRRTIPIHGLVVQGLSGEQTAKPVDDLQAPTMFEDDLEPGVFHPMKAQAQAQPVQPMAKPLHRPSHAEMKAKQRKREQEKALAKAQRTADAVSKALRIAYGIKDTPKPKHVEVHTETGLVLSVRSRNPNAIKRRF